MTTAIMIHVVRVHGAAQDETVLFERRATARLTRQGGRLQSRSRRVFVQKGAVGQEHARRHEPGVEALWQSGRSEWWKQAKVSVER